MAQKRILSVLMNGEPVGSWIHVSGREASFTYEKSWLDATGSRPISLSLPLSSRPIIGRQVDSFFDNLLPDNSEIRGRLQRRFNCPSRNPFDLLSAVGKDCAGALQILPENSSIQSIRRIDAIPLSEAQVASVLRTISIGQIPGDVHDEAFRISIAGAQEKTALLYYGNAWCIPQATTPTTHIFKLPLGIIGGGINLSQSIENEWLCLQILKAFGLPVADAKIVQFEDQKALCVKRFDRCYASDKSWIIRIPQEDICQATGISPEKKYESEGGPGISSILKLLQGSHNARYDRKTFLKAQLLYWLLAASDGHAKNFSLFIEAEGAYHLTPLYDVISAYPISGKVKSNIFPQRLRLAMSVGKQRHYEWRKFQKRHWIETAALTDTQDMISEIIGEIIDSKTSVINQISSNLPDGFPEYLAESILSGLDETSKLLE
ncbi:MAG: type II toxin-antitoxin system HipA family toxin [Spirochaetia bacterium]|jgi:serine/threonine-protein kinase HipA|nr:type II toxin-antitoxin system HipA family toxin [Spirochaetia bacterium]